MISSPSLNTSFKKLQNQDEACVVKSHFPVAQTTVKEPVPDNFAKGVAFFLISLTFSSSQTIFGKLLYRSQTSLTPFEMLAYRAFISTLINFATLNIGAKKALWDSIPRGQGH